jgi:hypothetical protein
MNDRGGQFSPPPRALTLSSHDRLIAAAAAPAATNAVNAIRFVLAILGPALTLDANACDCTGRVQARQYFHRRLANLACPGVAGA